jgi:hypothetical protein
MTLASWFHFGEVDLQGSSDASKNVEGHERGQTSCLFCGRVLLVGTASLCADTRRWGEATNSGGGESGGGRPLFLCLLRAIPVSRKKVGGSNKQWWEESGGGRPLFLACCGPSLFFGAIRKWGEATNSGGGKVEVGGLCFLPAAGHPCFLSLCLRVGGVTSGWKGIAARQNCRCFCCCGHVLPV